MADSRNQTGKHVLSRRDFLKVTLASMTVTTMIGAGGVAYANRVEPFQIEMKSVAVTLPNLSPAFTDYRVVQISDIHMGTWMTRAHLEHIVRLVNQQQPDLIVITGDFVTINPVEYWAGELISVLSQLDAPEGTAAILGNHDHWTNPHVIREVIRDSGMMDLNNAVFTLERGREMLHIAGVDDYWMHQSDLDRVLDQLPDEGAAVLLAHEPDFADISAATGRFDLQMSGHSHGGQVVLPVIGAPILPRLGQKYPLGQYQVGNMIQYTNRGVGMVAPYVGFNCRPEITVYTLQVAKT